MTISLSNILTNRAQNQSEKQAYIFLQDGEKESASLTYGELDNLARRIASHLQSFKGERALLLYSSGLDFITAFFGCLYAGVIAVPVYPPRRNQKLSRLLAIVNDAQATVALTTTSILADIEQKWTSDAELAQLKLVATDTIESQNQDFVPECLTPDSLAFLQYTSGSTGTPKGVMVTHGNIIHNQEMIQTAFGHSEKTICAGWLPLFHDMGLIGNVLQPMYLGIPCILMPPVAFLQKPIRWLQAISKYRATTSGGPNFAYDLCVSKVCQEDLANLDLSSWDLAFNGAEPLRAETLEQFSQKFAACGFKHSAFYPCYGMAETTLFTTGGNKNQSSVIVGVKATDLEQNLAVETEISSPESRVFVGCGHPHMDTTVIIVNPESLTCCSQEQVGEIWVSSESVAAGYWNQPDATKETFQAYVKYTGNGPFLRTGDLGFLKNGELFVTGRLKDVIIIRGRNYYPQDIELTVENSHPSLRLNCSAAFTVEIEGEERLVVACEVERTYIRKLNTSEVIKEIQIAVSTEHELEVYGVALLKTGSIPKTSSGKIQRHACKQKFLENSLNVVGKWQKTIEQKKQQYVAPRTENEAIIANIFSDVLGVENIGINDNFFELGGHSLLATQLISRIGEVFSIEISLRALFSSPTVAQLEQTMTQLRTSNGEDSSAITLPTIIAIPEEKFQPFPLTDIQQAYWLGRNQNFDLGNVATHIYIEIDCSNLNLPRLNQAWQKLIEHHDMLRAVVLASGEQQILEQVPAYSIEVLDLRSCSQSEISEELDTIREQMSHEILPAEQWPLFKIRATILDEKRTRLHLSFDALVVDAWSMMLLLQQWQQLYENSQALLPPLEISFRDYVVTELSLKDTPKYQQAQKYWFNRNLPPAPQLPFALHPSSISKPTFKRHSARLEAHRWQQLKQRATFSNLTPSAVLLTAFADILNYWSKDPNFTINLTLFNRFSLHPQVNQLVGDFTSLTLLEVDNSIISSFTARAQRLQQQLWQDLDHNYVSGVEVQRELRRVRGDTQSMGVVFTSTLGLNSLMDDRSPSLNQLGEVVYAISQTPQVWLDHQIFEEDGALVFNWDVVEELFPAGLIEDMFASYCNWLEQLANTESAWSQTHPQLLPAHQQSTIVAVNDTDTPVAEKTLHGLFYKQVAACSQFPAVITANKTLTYQQLHQKASNYAQQLRQLGATPNTLVAVIMEKGWEQIVAVLGILMSGAAYLPISPELPQERQQYLLSQGKVNLVLTQPQLKQNLSLPSGIECLVVTEEELKPATLNLFESIQTPNDLAYVIYTSGSTGKPKGVIIDHKGAVNTILDINKRFGVGVDDRVLAVSALEFDLSVYDIFGILAAGGAIVIPEPAPSKRKDPAHWLELISAHQVTIWNTVPALMQMLVEHLSGSSDKQVGDLRLALLSGDWLPVELPNQIRSLYSDIQVISLGGATEASIWSIFYPIDKVESNCPSIPYGKPLDNQRFYVLNQLMQPTPTWVEGELYIGGIGLAKGYWQNEAKTNNSFITHPISQERLYKTGDLGRYLPSGDIEFLGREDFQLKINGFRIELGEIEAALKEHSAIKEAVVSSHNNQLVAYVVPEKEQVSFSQVVRIDKSISTQIHEYLKQKLPNYMVPSEWVILETLPLTANGKIDRKALPEPSSTKSPSSANVAPRTQSEQIIANIFAQVLNVENIGIHDNFFDLGGHSLLATQLISRVRKAFSTEISLGELFSSPTVAQLYQKLTQLRNTKILPPIQPRTETEQLPLSWAQERLWFLNQLEGKSATYNMPAAVRISGNLDINALQQAISEIVQRHEVLRTSFQTVNGTPIQVINPEANLNITKLDLQQLETAERENLVIEKAQEEATTPFDLENAPLIRCSLLQLSPSEYVLLLTMHHIISDGWSIGIFIQELSSLYQAFILGVASPLGQLPIQYADFAVWQRQWLSGEVLETKLNYWKQQLHGAPDLLELPNDYPRPQVQTYRGATENFTLNADLTTKLQTLSRESGTTLFMTLLAGFQLLLKRYTNQDDIIVGTDVANRNQAELEPLIGFFVNLLALRTDLSGNPSFRELLQQVRHVALEAYDHQELPFEKLVEALQPSRHLSHSPIFQVLFVLQNTPMPALELPGVTLELLEGKNETTKFDLGIFVRETEQGIEGSCQYRTELFKGSTIKTMLAHFEVLLNSIVTQPDTRINHLEMRTDKEKEQQMLKKKQNKASEIKKFMKVQPKAVNLSQDRLIKTDYLAPGEVLPLVITPNVDDLNIIEWAKNNRNFIEKNLLQNGAILFRNFGINFISDFENFAEAICPGLFGEYGDWEHPKSLKIYMSLRM